MSSEENPLEPTFMFGLTTAPTNSCLFMSENQIVYRASGVLVLHDVIEKSQKFLYMDDPQKVITTMDISNSKKLLAVAVKGKKPTVDIYNLNNLKLIRQLIVQTEMKARSFIRIKFSYNDVFLAVLSDSPDYIMYYFDWNQLKVESRVQIILPPSVPGLVHEMALNPVKNRLCCFVGTGLFRTMSMKELVWKQYGFHKAKKFNFTSACWLDGDSMLAGTADGQLFVFTEGELKAIYNVETLTDFDASLTDRNPRAVLPLPRLAGGKHLPIRHCTAMKNGLVFVVDGNHVYYYRRILDQKYKKITVFQIPDSEDRHPDGSLVKAINTLCISPKDSRMVCVTEDAQLYLSHTMSVPESSIVIIKPFGATLHTGGICGLSISNWTPVFMTCGKLDGTVKLWDYHECKLLLSRRYEENVVDVSLHPSGLFALVAFAAHFAFTVVSCTDGLTVRRTFKAVKCHRTRFSESGNRFAVVDGVAVDVYCTVWYSKLFRFDGHKSLITDLVWAANDWKIYSCDESGGLCRFNLYTGQHVTNIEFQNQTLCSVAVSNDLKNIYTASSDGKIREIYGRTVVRTKDLKHGVLTGIILSKSNDLMLVMCQYGGILSVSLPLRLELNYDELYVHNKCVSTMKLSLGNDSLITCSVDNSICIWRVKNTNVLHTDMTFEENTLSSTNYLRNKIDKIEEIKLKLEELTKRRDRDIVKITKNHEPRLRAAHDQYTMGIKRMELEKKETDALFHAEKARLENEISILREMHEQDFTTSKNDYEKQLLYEDEKYEQLIKDSSNSDADFKKKEETMTAEHQQIVQKLTDDFHRDLKVEEEMFEKVKDGMLKDMELIYLKINEFDDQFDREIVELKIYYNNKFQKLPAETRKCQAFVDAYEKNLKSNQIQGADFQFLYEKFTDDIKNLINKNENLDASITETETELMKHKRLKLEIDDTIESKKLDCDDMKKQLILLEINRKEQNNVIDTLKSTTADMKITLEGVIDEMESAKVDFKIVKSGVTDNESKVALISSEIVKAKEHHQSQNAAIMQIAIDIQLSIKNSDDGTKLKTIYDQFVKKDKSSSLKMDLYGHLKFKEELLIYLKNLKIADDRKAPLHLKMIKDNTILVQRVNELNKEIARNKFTFHELEPEVAEETRSKRPKKNQNAVKH